jgi:NAD(P)H dehydrogenase (quinone)
MKLAISGASGKLGRLTVEELLAKVPVGDIVLTTRTPENLAEYAERGVEVRFADFDKRESLPDAFAGIDRMIMISASNATGRREDQHGAAIAAAVAQGVQHIVFPSMPKVDDPNHPVGLTAEEYRDAEEALAASGTSWTVLRDGPYAELHVVERFKPAIAAGRMAINTGDGTAGFVKKQDVAAALVGVVTDEPGKHAGEIYDISGPELLTFEQVAEKLSAVSGRELEYVEVDDETFAAEARDAGVPPLMVDALTGMGKAVREGYFAVKTDMVQQLTGRKPASLDEVLAEHREELAAAAATA